MNPIRTIIIREYWNGYYDVEHDGRIEHINSREELRMSLKRLLELPGDPDLIEQIRDLEQGALDKMVEERSCQP